MAQLLVEYLRAGEAIDTLSMFRQVKINNRRVWVKVCSSSNPTWAHLYNLPSFVTGIENALDKQGSPIQYNDNQEMNTLSIAEKMKKGWVLPKFSKRQFLVCSTV